MTPESPEMPRAFAISAEICEERIANGEGVREDDTPEEPGEVAALATLAKKGYISVTRIKPGSPHSKKDVLGQKGSRVCPAEYESQLRMRESDTTDRMKAVAETLTTMFAKMINDVEYSEDTDGVLHFNAIPIEEFEKNKIRITPGSDPDYFRNKNQDLVLWIEEMVLPALVPDSSPDVTATYDAITTIEKKDGAVAVQVSIKLVDARTDDA
ncbi:hypothetical protein HOE67_05055 [Candidatus Peregrinibacteria bacterium]|jgi:hypothetical protein|nr:hypothetical protein [Candidatus Peregrinibacteria bacterium]MBT4056450.1 hypothetical protein [Candidatus Peregrinibacteria bacterium]